MISLHEYEKTGINAVGANGLFGKPHAKFLRQGTITESLCVLESLQCKLNSEFVGWLKILIASHITFILFKY